LKEKGIISKGAPPKYLKTAGQLYIDNMKLIAKGTFSIIYNFKYS
jgi:hypothetical protein